MIKISKYLSLFFLAIPMFSQNISLVRTDVDSTRNGIITATFVFGVDIKIDSVPNCSSVAFLLKYTNPDIVKFSGFRNRDFETTGVSSINIPTNPTEDGVLNEASMNISIYSGLAPGENKFNSPTVLHLEFVVLQNATANQLVTFTFQKATAIGFVDSLAQEIKLKSSKTIYKVHSFVDVFPGDASNDKIVNTDDYSTIGLYMRKGADDRESRTFKRANASTQWFAQRVLTWDVAAATFADCDGDGTVTVVDGLVVKMNDGKVASEFGGTKSDKIQSNGNDYYNFEPLSNLKTLLVPININSNDSYIAFSGKIDLNKFSDYSFAGIRKGDKFNSIATSTLVDYSQNDNKVEYFITAQNNVSLSNSNNIAYLMLEPKANGTNTKLFVDSDILAYDNLGKSKLFNTISSVEQTVNDIIVTENDKEILISPTSETTENSSYSLVSINGINVANGTLINKQMISKSSLPNGIYFLQLQNGSSTKLYKFVVLN